MFILYVSFFFFFCFIPSPPIVYAVRRPDLPANQMVSFTPQEGTFFVQPSLSDTSLMSIPMTSSGAGLDHWSYKITQFYSAPTTICLMRRLGAHHVENHNLSTLRVLGSVGELINLGAWNWNNDHVGKRQGALVGFLLVSCTYSVMSPDAERSQENGDWVNRRHTVPRCYRDKHRLRDCPLLWY